MSAKGVRLLKVFKALEAHPIIGISNKEISDGLGISPVHVSRDLETCFYFFCFHGISPVSFSC